MMGTQQIGMVICKYTEQACAPAQRAPTRAAGSSTSTGGLFPGLADFGFADDMLN